MLSLELVCNDRLSLFLLKCRHLNKANIVSKNALLLFEVNIADKNLKDGLLKIGTIVVTCPFFFFLLTRIAFLVLYWLTDAIFCLKDKRNSCTLM